MAKKRSKKARKGGKKKKTTKKRSGAKRRKTGAKKRSSKGRKKTGKRRAKKASKKGKSRKKAPRRRKKKSSAKKRALRRSPIKPKYTRREGEAKLSQAGGALARGSRIAARRMNLASHGVLQLNPLMNLGGGVVLQTSKSGRPRAVGVKRSKGARGTAGGPGGPTASEIVRLATR